MAKSYGLWRVTPAGLQAYREFDDPLVFIRTATRIKNARRARQGKPPEGPAGSEVPVDPPPPDEEAPDPRTLTLGTARQRAWSEIRARRR
jgi:hypothetical protein